MKFGKGEVMDKQELKYKIQNSIKEKTAIEFLESLIRVPSENLKTTYAQELVRLKLLEMGMEIDSFPCAVEEIENLPDFCDFDGNRKYREDIQNIVAVKQAKGEKKFLIHAHIDTAERTNIIPDFKTEQKDGKLYGLGVADDKCGIAMMLIAADAVLKECPELKNQLILMSTIGKRGAIGTLSAFQKGYHADAAIYLHPAETGHGFLEIKNYSMGELDFKISIKGKEGVFRDEIDDSEISAITEGARVIEILKNWDKERRKKHFFEDETFQGLPNTKLNFLDAHSEELLRDDALKFEISCRLYFGLDESIDQIIAELKQYLKDALKNNKWLLTNPPEFAYGVIKASSAYIARNSQLITTLENNINDIKKYEKEFIYQYHAGSDIRIPIIYGNTPTVGIGPLCGGLAQAGEKEWVDITDYIAGIKIVIGMIVDWCL